MVSLIISLDTYSQIREFKIHDRGMLHHTVYNTGELGRGWMYGDAGNKTNVPVFEWPGRSATILEGIEYSGQHNIIGAGVWIGANLDGNPGLENRLFAWCGGTGSSSPEVSMNRWSFPISMDEIENFPLLPNGDLNPDYDPDEAEEIIIAKWSTSAGITVTRTSRAWSYPDYDDMIIYEYEFEHTGDTDGDLATVEIEGTLKDVIVGYCYGIGPSMYGYQRHYGEWKYNGAMYKGDQRHFWDYDYWLLYHMDSETAGDTTLAGKPEPNPAFFKEFAETGKNGGGICSPQAPGFCFLYYDYDHLAIVDPDNSAVNESEYAEFARIGDATAGIWENVYYEIDENQRIKQPWGHRQDSGNTKSSKMNNRANIPQSRYGGFVSPNSSTWPEPPSDRWIGRGDMSFKNSNRFNNIVAFGPYTLDPGEKIKVVMADVCGYGAEPGKRIEGGQTKQQWGTNPTWNKQFVIDGQLMTENYLDDFGYPDYVNSDVVNVTQVAQKAFEAYLGKEPELPAWPEDNPSEGVYQVPTPVPAPVIKVENWPGNKVRVSWKRAVENFSHPRLMGELDKFNVYRSNSGMGPWTLLGTVQLGNVNSENMYEFIDTDQDFRVGEQRYYAVTSVDENGKQSGKTNISLHQKNIRSVAKLDKVYVVPNPFVVKSGFEGTGEVEKQIGFYALPEKCTIRIFSYSGQLIQTIEHDDAIYSTEWLQVTRSEQEIASGVYFYVVTTPEGEKTSGKFIIIK